MEIRYTTIRSARMMRIDEPGVCFHAWVKVRIGSRW